MNAAVIGLGSATPDPIAQERLWDEFFAAHFDHDPAARLIFRRSGVRTRGGCVIPMKEDVREWTTTARMRRFVEEAVALGQDAVARCLDAAGLEAGEVDLFAVASCTGYTTPGIDVLIATALSMREDVERLHVGHMGCYAALPGLAAVADAARGRGKTAVLLSVEVPSIHVQPPTDDVEQVVAHALFADGAAAAAVAPRRRGLEVVDVAARTDAARGGHMQWDLTERGFRMALSPDIPEILAEHLGATVGGLLARHGLRIADVAGWAVHPGGPRILDVVADRLGLDDVSLSVSREVLATHGNTSSATALIILERILATRPLGPGDPVVMLAFGPGLTLYGGLLRFSR